MRINWGDLKYGVGTGHVRWDRIPGGTIHWDTVTGKVDHDMVVVGIMIDMWLVDVVIRTDGNCMWKDEIDCVVSIAEQGILGKHLPEKSVDSVEFPERNTYYEYFWSYL